MLLGGCQFFLCPGSIVSDTISKSMFSFGLFSNPLILLGIAAELGLLLFIVYTPAGNWLFGTAPVGRKSGWSRWRWRC